MARPVSPGASHTGFESEIPDWHNPCGQSGSSRPATGLPNDVFRLLGIEPVPTTDLEMLQQLYKQMTIANDHIKSFVEDWVSSIINHMVVYAPIFKEKNRHGRLIICRKKLDLQDKIIESKGGTLANLHIHF